jgi:hypothetical protein
MVVSHDAAHGCSWPRASNGWNNLANCAKKVKGNFVKRVIPQLLVDNHPCHESILLRLRTVLDLNKIPAE